MQSVVPCFYFKSLGAVIFAVIFFCFVFALKKKKFVFLRYTGGCEVQLAVLVVCLRVVLLCIYSERHFITLDLVTHFPHSFVL